MSTITEIDRIVIGYLAERGTTIGAEVGEIFLCADAEIELTTEDFNHAISRLIAAGLAKRTITRGHIAITSAGIRWNDRNKQIKPPTESEPVNEKLHRAEDFLKRELQRGPRNSKDLIQGAHEMENIGRNTLYEAAQRLHVVRDSGMRVHGGSAWYLPHAETLESNGVLADWTEK